MYTRVHHFASWIFRSSVNHLQILRICGQGVLNSENVWVCFLALSDLQYLLQNKKLGKKSTYFKKKLYYLI